MSKGVTQPGGQTSDTRLNSARRRDTEALLRDLLADARDDEDIAREPTITALLAMDNAALLEYLNCAQESREAAAEDRARAARDRAATLADLETLTKQLTLAETDHLTGARTRGAGLGELDDEIDRCRRTAAPLVVTYIDVVGLKLVNDIQGHPAGDELLKSVVAQIRAHLRRYDHIVRLGGDEFLCAMPGLTEAEAHERFNQVAKALVAAPVPSAIRTGFTTLEDRDTLTDLIERADSDLLNRRHGMRLCRDDESSADPALSGRDLRSEVPDRPRERRRADRR